MKTANDSRNIRAALRTVSASGAMLSLLVLSACGGGGGSSSSDGDGDGGGGDDTTATGVFVDGRVGNIDFETSSGESGTTDDDGTFTYQSGDTITFSIGDIELPSAPADAIVTPIDMSDSGSIDDTVANILRFVQSLDEDGDPGNGITVSDSVKSAAADQSLDFTAPPDDFETDANAVVSTVSDGRVTSIVDSATATEHFTGALAEEGVSDSDSLVGSYYLGSSSDAKSDVLVFAGDGSFYHAHYDQGGVDSGFEVGTYSYVGDEIHTSISTDTNGDTGFNTSSGELVFTVNELTDSALTIQAEGETEETTLTPVDSTSGNLTGAWHFDEPQGNNYPAVLVFNGDGSSGDYFHIQLEEPNEPLGVENGTYTVASGSLSSTVGTVDTNEDAGPDGNTFSVSVDGDELTLDDEITLQRIDTVDTDNGGSTAGSTAAFQRSDIENRVFQYEVTESSEGEVGNQGFVVFEGSGTSGSGFALDFNDVTDAGGSGREDNFDWSIADGDVTLDFASGDTVTLTGIESRSTSDGTEVYTITTSDPASSEMALRRSVPFEEANFSGNTYVVEVNIDDAANGTATIDFGNDMFDDGADRQNAGMTWSVDPDIGFLTINLSSPEEEITVINLGDTTDDANFDEVLVLSETFDSDRDNIFNEAYPGSSLTRQ